MIYYPRLRRRLFMPGVIIFLFSCFPCSSSVLIFAPYTFAFFSLSVCGLCLFLFPCSSSPSVPNNYPIPSFSLHRYPSPSLSFHLYPYLCFLSIFISLLYFTVIPYPYSPSTAILHLRSLCIFILTLVLPPSLSFTFGLLPSSSFPASFALLLIPSLFPRPYCHSLSLSIVILLPRPPPCPAHFVFISSPLLSLFSPSIVILHPRPPFIFIII